MKHKPNFDKGEKKLSNTYEEGKNSTSHHIRTRDSKDETLPVKGDYPGVPDSSQVMTIITSFLTGKKVQDTNLKLYKNFLQPSQVGKLNDFIANNKTALTALGVVGAGLALYLAL